MNSSIPTAGWSSLVARQARNPEDAGPNLAFTTKRSGGFKGSTQRWASQP